MEETYRDLYKKAADIHQDFLHNRCGIEKLYNEGLSIRKQRRNIKKDKDLGDTKKISKLQDEVEKRLPLEMLYPTDLELGEN